MKKIEITRAMLDGLDRTAAESLGVKIYVQVTPDEVFAMTGALRERDAMKRRIAELERHNADLQAANNRYLQRARDAEALRPFYVPKVSVGDLRAVLAALSPDGEQS